MTTTDNTTTEPAVGPCPPWCALEPGHDWDSYMPDGRLARPHGVDDRPDIHGLTDRSSAWVSIGAWEVAGEGLGAVSLAMSAEGDFTADQARAFAAQVFNVAYELDRVTR